MMAIMSDDLVSRLATLGAAAMSLEPGQALFHRDDPVRRLFAVETGVVQLVRHHEDGAVIVLQRAGAGDLVAEASIFSERYHCDAVAVAPSRIRSIPKRAVLAHLAEEPGAALGFAEHLGRQIRGARLRAEILSLRTVGRRLDAWLAAHDGELPARGERKRVAQEIGVSPEALYRELARRRARPG